MTSSDKNKRVTQSPSSSVGPAFHEVIPSQDYGYCKTGNVRGHDVFADIADFNKTAKISCEYDFIYLFT